ncbi:hypothetical protein DPSP01_014442 [Paraphaeosphaeria sporulosa]
MRRSPRTVEGVQKATKQKNDKKIKGKYSRVSDTLLRSALTAGDAVSEPPIQGSDQQPEPMSVDHQQTGNDHSPLQDITIASGGRYHIADRGNSIEALQESKICVDDIRKGTDEHDDKSASLSDFELLRMLKQRDGDTFESNIHSLRGSNEYWGGGKMFLLSYREQNRELSCGETNMMKILTAEAIQSLLERDQSSETGGPLAIPSPQARASRFTEQRSTKPTPGATVPHKENKHRKSDADTTGSVRNQPARSSVAPERHRDEDADYIIIAKNILASWQGRIYGVMGGTHCLIRDRSGRHEYITWAQIQQSESEGSVSFQDEDYGQGLHAKADRDFLQALRSENKLTAVDYEVDDAVMYESEDQTAFHITVFVTLKSKEKLSLLLKRRNIAGYDYGGPIRSSPSGFIGAGGKKEDFAPILKRRQPDMYKRYLGRRKGGGARERSSAREANGIRQIQETLEKLCGSVKHLTDTTEIWMQTIIAHR